MNFIISQFLEKIKSFKDYSFRMSHLVVYDQGSELCESFYAISLRNISHRIIEKLIGPNHSNFLKFSILNYSHIHDWLTVLLWIQITTYANHVTRVWAIWFLPDGQNFIFRIMAGRKRDRDPDENSGSDTSNDSRY